MHRLAYLLILCVVVLAVGPAGTGQAAETMRLARVSYSTGWDALPIVVGIERGLFARHDLIVSGVAAQDAKSVAASLAAGSTDVAIMPQRAFLALVDAGVEVTAIAVNTWGSQLQLLAAPRSAVQAVPDLRGRTIAVSRGSGAVGILMRLLNQNGLTQRDVRLLELPANGVSGALDTGRADAAFEFAHLTAPIVAAGRGRVILDAEAVRKKLGLIAAMPVVASNRFLAREPETARAVIAGWIDAQRYIHEQPDDSATLMRVFLHRHGVTASERLVSMWIGMQRYDQPAWTPNAVKDAEYNAWGLRELGLIKTVPDVARHVDNRFVEQTAATGR